MTCLNQRAEHTLNLLLKKPFLSKGFFGGSAHYVMECLFNPQKEHFFTCCLHSVAILAFGGSVLTYKQTPEDEFN